VIAVAAAALAGCTTTSGTPTTPLVSSTGGGSSADGSGAPRSTAAAPSSAGPSGPGKSCPPAYRSPDPNRPSVRLDFHLSRDLSTVRGTEHIAFTPDRPITELVFRLTANTVPTVREGN
jgi:hypothetical protein